MNCDKRCMQDDFWIENLTRKSIQRFIKHKYKTDVIVYLINHKDMMIELEKRYNTPSDFMKDIDMIKDVCEIFRLKMKYIRTGCKKSYETKEHMEILSFELEG